MGLLLLLSVPPVLRAASKLDQVIPTEVTVVATVMAEADTAARTRMKNRGQMDVLSNLGSVVQLVDLRHGRWAVVVVVAVVVVGAAAVVVVDVVAMEPDPTGMHLPPMLPQDRAAYHLGNKRKVMAPQQDRPVVRPHRGERRSTVYLLLHLPRLRLPHGLQVHLGLLLE